MPLNLKITWGAGASSARLMGLEDGITLGDLKTVVATKSGIDCGRLVATGLLYKDVVKRCNFST